MSTNTTPAAPITERITLTVRRTELADWALWADLADATHAVLMDTDEGGTVWVGTTAGNATTYGRMHGWERVAVVAPVGPRAEVVAAMTSGECYVTGGLTMSPMPRVHRPGCRAVNYGIAKPVSAYGAEMVRLMRPASCCRVAVVRDAIAAAVRTAAAR